VAFLGILRRPDLSCINIHFSSFAGLRLARSRYQPPFAFFQKSEIFALSRRHLLRFLELRRSKLSLSQVGIFLQTLFSLDFSDGYLESNRFSPDTLVMRYLPFDESSNKLYSMDKFGETFLTYTFCTSDFAIFDDYDFGLLLTKSAYSGYSTR
jgi:hypothetical protein